ncbi:MAG TPA: VCBS repeat-containing protein, partial [Flavobacteriales bacterium]
MSSSLRPTILLFALGVLCARAVAQFGAQYQYFAADPMALDLRDMDGDGAPDMVVSSRDGVDVMRNTGGPGLFAPPTPVVYLEVLSWAVDVDNDLLPELIGSQPDVPGVRMYRNQGGLTFGEATTLHPAMRVMELKSADVDHDGDQDLVFITGTEHIGVMYNVDANGQFSIPSFLGVPVPGAEHIDLVDVNGDDAIDAVFSSRVSGSTYACLNVQGTLDSPVPMSAAGTGVVRDLDNDGLADVLLVNEENGTVFWQRNLGVGAMGEAQVLDASFIGANRIRACDVDADGDMDVLASSNFTQEIAWFENLDGLGHFGIRQTVAYSMPGINGIVNSDVDNDGDEDVFVSSVDLDKIFWYTNLTNATGAVMGRVFNDINGDGIFNGNDHGLANIRVVCSDLGSTYSNASGMYWYNVQNTDYALGLPPVSGWHNTTPDYYEIQVPENGASQFNDFGLQANAAVSALDPLLTSSPTRCNEDVIYWATVTNTGNQVSDVHLMLTLDAYSQFQGAVPSPTETIGDAVIWVFPGVQPTHQRSVRLMVTMPGTDMMGEPMTDHLDAVAMLNGNVLST